MVDFEDNLLPNATDRISQTRNHEDEPPYATDNGINYECQLNLLADHLVWLWLP